jgi:hypothetical protein
VARFWASRDIAATRRNKETLNLCDNKKSRDWAVDIIHSVCVCVCSRLDFQSVHIHMSVWSVSTLFVPAAKCTHRLLFRTISPSVTPSYPVLPPPTPSYPLLCTLFTFARGYSPQITEVSAVTLDSHSLTKGPLEL